jgi:hypothetical protein
MNMHDSEASLRQHGSQNNINDIKHVHHKRIPQKTIRLLALSRAMGDSFDLLLPSTPATTAGEGRRAKLA